MGTKSKKNRHIGLFKSFQRCFHAPTGNAGNEKYVSMVNQMFPMETGIHAKIEVLINMTLEGEYVISLLQKHA